MFSLYLHNGGATLRALLIASTILSREYLAQTPYTEHPFPDGAETVLSADELAEFAGRACYESWERPNPATATNAGYLANIIRQQHFSVLEHASATFYITGISRSLTHELIRHRHLSFSQVSQRFVDSTSARFVIPPAFRNDDKARAALGYEHEVAVDTYEWLAERALKNGLSRKEAREAARCVLPNMTETAIVVTGNMRAWRDVIEKRAAPGADAEIRELADELLRQLQREAPNTFQDFTRQDFTRQSDDDADPIGRAVLTA